MDFSIICDFGRIPGFDINYRFDGYCNHTKYDTECKIRGVCLQYAGDLISCFLRRTACDEDLSSSEKLSVSEIHSSNIQV